MIYSSWRADKGGYNYFDSGERYGLGDDLPVPKLPGTSPIGVSSITAGRLPKNGVLKPAGSGAYARGAIMATDVTGLQGLGVLSSLSIWTVGGLSAIGGALLFYFLEKKD